MTLPGVNVLLMGPAGTGKTHSIGTLVETGIETFYLNLESGKESLVGYFTDRGKPVPDNLHIHSLTAPAADFLSMLDTAKKVNTLGLDSLAKLIDPNKCKYNQFIGLLEALNNFTDSTTGVPYGAVNSWGPDKALVIDGLTGISLAAMQLVIGGKPVKSMADWGIAQDQCERLIRMLADNCQCHFILLAHVERETDQVLGGVKIMPSCLGKALAPKLPSIFSDVLLCVRNADKWVWDTANTQADTKTRNLPIAAANAQNFATIITKWKSRGGTTDKAIE